MQAMENVIHTSPNVETQASPNQDIILRACAGARVCPSSSDCDREDIGNSAGRLAN